MNVYTINYDDNLEGAAFWVQDVNAKQENPLRLQHVLADDRFGQDVILPSEPFSVEMLAEVNSGKWLLIDTEDDVRNAYDALSKSRHSGMLIIDQGIKDVIEDLDPGVNEFVRIPKVWHKRNQCEVTEPFYLLNVLRKVDGFDPDSLSIGKRADGTTYIRAIGRGKLNTAAVADFHVWRDSQTNDPFVSEEFKRRAEAVGIRGVRFSDPMRMV